MVFYVENLDNTNKNIVNWLLLDLFEERAILLSRIGQHDQALDIYVYKLKNYVMAEEYVSKLIRVYIYINIYFYN